MGNGSDPLRTAREAFARRDWLAAREGFNAVRQTEELSADDLNSLGDAAWWIGDVDEALSAYEGAYRLYLQGEMPRQAATSALGLAVSLFLRGDVDLGSGWMNRAQRLLRDEPEGPEHGYLAYLDLEGGLSGGDFDGVITKAQEIREMGRRHGDANLTAVGILFEGRALVRRGQMNEGMALLDEAMVAVLTDELSPEWAGNIYCHLMSAFHELADLRRANEWVKATTRWIESLPPAVLFAGICRIHRSQVMQTTGAWSEAEREAIRVCQELNHLHVAGAAEGHYQIGELRRLRGDFAAAEEAYELAHERGRDPQPGLALLRLAEGRIDAASASIRAALAAQPNDPLARFRLLGAQVEIALAAHDLSEAERACEELEETASVYGTSGLRAVALHMRGALLVARRPEEALPTLRAASTRWRELDAPYEAARVCLLLATAYRALGDGDAVARELEAAASVFDRVGATLELKTVADIRANKVLPDGLTVRQAEILALVAAGNSNREIAADLVLSQKTVARHLSNIFTKLGISSRTAAAAYAFEHNLVPGSRGSKDPRGRSQVADSAR
jgi:DNA-binding NarL/FixJ family response regulator